MSARVKQVVGGGITIAVLAAFTPMILPLCDKWFAHRERMQQIRYSDITWNLIDECEESGGRWWKGDCIGPTEEEDE